MTESDDKYKIFDASEFQSRQFLGGTVCIDANGIVVFKRHIAFKMAVMLLLLLLGCVLLLLFLFLFSFSSRRAGELSVQVSALQAAQQQTCTTEQCLQHAAYLSRIMNKSADPCTDFYEFACGNYDQILPYDHWFSYTHVFKEMNAKAMEQVELALTRPTLMKTPRWVRKVRMYYRTCLAHYRTYTHYDNPLVSRVFNTTAGLADYLFGRGVDAVDVDQLFRTVSGKYYIHSLVGAFTWWNDYLHRQSQEKRYSIWVGRSGRSIGLLRFNLYFSHHHDIYLDFVKDIARLLIRDSRMTIANSELLVNTFANDVLDIESELYQIQRTAYYSEWQNFNSDPPHHPDNMIEVSELNRKFPFIDFIAYLREIYGKYNIRESTKVVLYSEHYLEKLKDYFTSNNASTSQQFKRKISNYFTWVATMFFEWDLSPEYRQKFKSIRDISWGNHNPEENSHSFCFATTEWAMQQALSGLYVREYFSDSGRDRANQLYSQLLDATKSRIDSLHWMDASTKLKSKQKVESIVEKAGYPAEAKDDTYLNREYQMISTSYPDYFQLLIDSLEYKKSAQRKLLSDYNPLDFQHWGKLYDTHFSYHLYDNEILVQAGVLQTPLFSLQLPQQLVYGGYGTLIAHEIMRAFDVKGQLYDQSTGYRKSGGWWSAQSLRDYKTRAQCVRDSMKEMLQFYEDERLAELSDEERDKKIESLLHKEVNWTVREIGAVEIARSAFNLHGTAGDQLKSLPTFARSQNQMFYIAYAQMNCHHQGWFYDWSNWQKNFYPYRIAINTVVGNIPDFSRQFNCQPESQLNPKEKCNVY